MLTKTVIMLHHTTSLIVNYCLQGWSTPVLEGHCPAEFSFNPNYTHLNKLINVFRITKNSFLSELELKFAGQWPSRTGVTHPWSTLYYMSYTFYTALPILSTLHFSAFLHFWLDTNCLSLSL